MTYRASVNSVTPLSRNVLPLRSQIVAANCRVPSGTQTISAATLRVVTRRSKLLAGTRITNLQLGYCGWYVTSTPAELPLGNDVVVTPSLELSSPVTYRPAYMAKSAQGINVPNDDPLVISDAVPFSVPSDTVIFSRTDMQVPVDANKICLSGNTRSGGTDVGWRYTGALLVNNTGYINDPGSSTYFDAMEPCLILGTPLTPINSVVGMGDSWFFGQGDTADAVTGAQGLFQRGLQSVNGHAIPSVNCGISSERIANITAAKAARRMAFWQYGTDIFFWLGNNDIALDSRTAAQVVNDIISACTVAKSIINPYGRPLKTHVGLIPPRVTSTDSYATLANQTPITGFAPGGVREQTNNLLKSSVGNGVIDSVIDLNSVFEEGTTGKWKVNGTANYATADGTHPSAAFYVLGGAALATYALTNLTFAA